LSYDSKTEVKIFKIALIGLTFSKGFKLLHLKFQSILTIFDSVTGL